MHNAHALAMRDPALAALVGAIQGADFGEETSSDFASEFAADFGTEFGDDMHGDFGDDFMGDFGDAIPVASAAVAAIPKPTAQQALNLWRSHHVAKARGNARVRHLEPNAGSSRKIEKYMFPLPAVALLFGTITPIVSTSQPDTTFRPQRVLMNTPAPGFVALTEIKVSNISVTVGPGPSDAFFFNAGGVGVALDMPTLSPANRATVTGNSSVYVPPGYVVGTNFPFSVAFVGIAEMAG
jgi:hypothetical protein